MEEGERLREERWRERGEGYREMRKDGGRNGGRCGRR